MIDGSVSERKEEEGRYQNGDKSCVNHIEGKRGTLEVIFPCDRDAGGRPCKDGMEESGGGKKDKGR